MNYMTKWIKSGNNKQIKILHGGEIAVIAPEDTSSIIPLFCFCCELPMKDSSDSISYRNNGVCGKCDDYWTNRPGINWPDGPDKESKEWENYLKERLLLESPVINFK